MLVALQEMAQIARDEGYDDVEEWLRDIYGKHKSVIRLAQIYGFSDTTFLRYLKRYGIPLQSRGGPGKQKWFVKRGLTEPQARRLLEELLKQGKDVGQIAGELGVTKAAVRIWIRKFGLVCIDTAYVLDRLYNVIKHITAITQDEMDAKQEALNIVKNLRERYARAGHTREHKRSAT